MQTPTLHLPLAETVEETQSVPSGLEGRAGHVPVEALQETAVWQESGRGQVTPAQREGAEEGEDEAGTVPAHVPFVQLSFVVFALPSLQEVPSALFGSVGHVPVAGLQVTAV